MDNENRDAGRTKSDGYETWAGPGWDEESSDLVHDLRRRIETLEEALEKIDEKAGEIAVEAVLALDAEGADWPDSPNRTSARSPEGDVLSRGEWAEAMRTWRVELEADGLGRAAVARDRLQANYEALRALVERYGQENTTLRAALEAAERERELGAVVAEFLAWAEETFPEATPETCIAHLRSEVDEELSAEGGARDPEELADAAMLVFHAAYRAGVDFTEALRRKLEKNRMREWGPPNEQGFREHVRARRLAEGDGDG